MRGTPFSADQWTELRSVVSSALARAHAFCFLLPRAPKVVMCGWTAVLRCGENINQGLQQPPSGNAVALCSSPWPFHTSLTASLDYNVKPTRGIEPVGGHWDYLQRLNPGKIHFVWGWAACRWGTGRPRRDGDCKLQRAVEAVRYPGSLHSTQGTATDRAR